MSIDPAESERPRRRAVAIWLWTCVAALLALIVLGGVVRLTRSGLSITVWDPIMGAIPPLDHAAWERAFELYRQSPEFRDVNRHMDLAGFKGIFWLEYIHRLLARSIGLLVALPLGVFLWRRMLDKRLVRHLVILFLLGGLQGLIGWLMVASGLVDAAHVSHYRLTLHLGMGFVLFGYAVLLAAWQTFGPRVARPSTGLERATRALTVLAAVTVLSGGLVAGLKSGHAFPTFPLIGGQWVPDGMAAAHPLWRNFVDNTITVQFQHRVLATLVFVSVCGLWWWARKAQLPRPARLAFDAALVVVCIQVALGISTLLLHVPVALAAAHQGNAALLVGVLLFANFALGRWPREVALSDTAKAAPGETPALARS